MDHVLYFLADPSRAALRHAEEALEQTAKRVSPLRARQVRIAFETSAVRALAKLRSGGAEALVIDARGEAGGAEESTSLGLLRGLFGEHDLARVIGREHTWIVVDADPSGAALASEAGRLHLGGVIAVPNGRDVGGDLGAHRLGDVARPRRQDRSLPRRRRHRGPPLRAPACSALSSISSPATRSPTSTSSAASARAPSSAGCSPTASIPTRSTRALRPARPASIRSVDPISSIPTWASSAGAR